MKGMMNMRIVTIDKYEIWMGGSIVNFKTGKALKPQDNGRGYKKVTLSIMGKQIQRYIHRLVASAHCPNPENKPHVNHKDGNKANNASYNLEWVTPLQNSEHAIESGLCNSGEQCYNAKFTERDINRMRFLDKHIARYKIAQRMGCSKSTVSDILNGKRYKHFALTGTELTKS